MIDAKPLRIFLSYGHDANEELVLRIHSDLTARGHDVWIDRIEIKFGDDWRREITEGILGSHQVLSFLSKHSVRDPGVCLDEIRIAIGVKGGNIQTVLVESELEARPPASISHVQWLDMRDWKDRYVPTRDDWGVWYQQKLAEIVQVVESNGNRKFAGEIETLNGYLKPIPSDTRISTLLRKGFVGREWVFEAIEQWRNSADRESRIFWIEGEPGVGKSALAAHLTHFGRDRIVAAQFVEWDKPDHRDARRVIRSLAFQLATRLPDFRKFLITLPEIAKLDDKKSAGELFDYLLADPLHSAIGGGRERYLMVIDALDEAGDAGHNPLVELLANNAMNLPDWIGLVVTSRPESSVKAPLQGLRPLVLDTRTEANRADIRAFLRYRLASDVQDRPDARQLIERILASSEGVFLYAESFCEDVRRGHLSLDRPQEFPQGLGGKYYSDFNRYFPEAEQYRRDIRPALRAILAAREPLPVETLQRLFNWQDEELRDFTRTLGSLFPVVKAANSKVIRPYHKSLADWLADETKAGAFFVSVLEGHQLLADVGWQEYRDGGLPEGSYFHGHLARHLAESERYDRLLELVADVEFGLLAKWTDKGFSLDGRYCLERLLSDENKAQSSKGVSAALATQLARIDLRDGRFDRASFLLRRALDDTATEPPGRIQAIASHEFGSVHYEQGENLEARQWYRKSLRLARKTIPSLDKEIAANLLAIAMTYRHTPPVSERINRLALLALKYAQGSGDLPHESEAFRLLADVNKDKMDYPAAERYLASGMLLATSAELPYALMSLLTCKGWLLYQRAALTGDSPETALHSFRELLKTAERKGHNRFQADAWCGIGQCSLLANDLGLAQQALQWLRGLPDHQMYHYARVRCSIIDASMLHRQGQYEAAFIAFGDSLAMASEAGNWARQADAEVGRGAAKYYQGNTVLAECHWQEAIPLSQRCPKIRQTLVRLSIELSRQSPASTPL